MPRQPRAVPAEGPHPLKGAGRPEHYRARLVRSLRVANVLVQAVRTKQVFLFRQNNYRTSVFPGSFVRRNKISPLCTKHTKGF